MNLLKRVQEFAAFTKNEQRIFLLLSLIFLAGVSIRLYKAYFVPPPARQFDYTALDKEFEERSKRLQTLSQEPRTARDTTSSERRARPAKKVNLNVATKSELLALPGVGESIATEILKFREAHGAFSSVDQLRKIKGIGTKKLEKIRPYVILK